VIELHRTIVLVLGTRPEIIKTAPLIRIMRQRKSYKTKFVFVHTGQHYDWNMSKVFLNELGIGEPDEFLSVGSSTHGVQTARILTRCEALFRRIKPRLVVVQGDTNSSLGGALAAAKLSIDVAHIEAGCRSFDPSMPEEINRVLISDLASIHFAPTQTCVNNLIREGIEKNKIYLTGHPIVDIVSQAKHRGHIRQEVLAKFGLKKKGYYLVTVHRVENTENKTKLENILSAISRLSKNKQVIFPIHPRTRKAINRFRLTKYLSNILVVNPVGYYDSLSLINYSSIVITDSGGIQQEAALLQTPCITLRTNTEWIETVTAGLNFLAGYEAERIIKAAEKMENQHASIEKRFLKAKEIFGRPPVTKRIVEIIKERLDEEST
jgi:UDP-N-acetylglucosamine 2-epimerase (non-hydrolysing)